MEGPQDALSAHGLRLAGPTAHSPHRSSTSGSATPRRSGTSRSSTATQEHAQTLTAPTDCVSVELPPTEKRRQRGGCPGPVTISSMQNGATGPETKRTVTGQGLGCLGRCKHPVSCQQALGSATHSVPIYAKWRNDGESGESRCSVSGFSGGSLVAMRAGVLWLFMLWSLPWL